MYILSIFINGFNALDSLNSDETIKVGGMSKETPLYTLVTSLFVHGSLTHLITNIILFITIGRYVCRHFGNTIYIPTFFLSGLLGNVLTKIVSDSASGGLSGCIYGLLAVMVLSSFNKESELYELRWLCCAVTLVLLITTFVFSHINIFAHSIGFITGSFIYCIYSAYKNEKEVDLNERGQ